ncbi:coiled-coil domain containing 169 isoform X2 [Pangasianodon hypophthalmus]|uniref:coiled-coil domain containing 169 isoform X2 n=1 Tax=Pangasianodon hypophthalmus TaxID=310915 RepID=UPI000EFE6010|nr:coiled-coil domain containing 169 isoform X2 [Pangasianodon hypophthalmus]
MGDGDISGYDLARLQAELEQEREMRELLKESVWDLTRTLADLEERVNSVDGEDRLASIRSYDEMTVDTLRHRLKLLSTEKSSLQSQLLECRLRIEQEGKAYQKAYDERRAYLSEIAKVSSAFDWTRKQQLAQSQKTTHSPGKGAPVMLRHDLKGKKGVASTVTQTRLPRLKR